MTTLSATRNVTLADATAMMEKIAGLACALAVKAARFEKRKLELEAAHQQESEPEVREYEMVRSRLAEFCRANPWLFEKPRKVKTAFGEFGLQKVSDLMILDKDLLLDAIMERGYEDCMAVTRRPIKEAIRDRIEAGETFPGCEVRVVENDPVVKVASDLLKAAVKGI